MRLGIIGGTALASIQAFKTLAQESLDTPYGSPSSPIVFAAMHGCEFYYLHRHGFDHTITPGDINYRANIWALKQLGVTHIIAIAAVGGITPCMTAGKIVFPDQLIDYTYSREHTFYDKNAATVEHIDFTNPYDETLRQWLLTSFSKTDLPHEVQGVYSVTQGPRLETAAEIKRLENDGGDIVGMTGMPEASLARELDIRYACCALVVNAAAGKNGDEIITMENIKLNLDKGMQAIYTLFEIALPDFRSFNQT